MERGMNRDFVEMLCALNETGAEFLIVGTHAVAAHGHPRATGSGAPVPTVLRGGDNSSSDAE